MDKLPVRVKIEVLIIRDKHVCVCKFIDKSNPSHHWFGFPGGGVEENDSHETTAQKECLEEVGIRIKNIRPLGLVKLFPPLFNKSERNKQYSGVEKHFYAADFDREDKSLYNTDGDAVEYVSWMSPVLAATRVKDNGEHGEFRLEALKKIMEEMHPRRPHFVQWGKTA